MQQIEKEDWIPAVGEEEHILGRDRKVWKSKCISWSETCEQSNVVGEAWCIRQGWE